MDKKVGHQSYCSKCGKPLAEVDYVQNALSVYAEHQGYLCSECYLDSEYKETIPH